ncbi:MAG TPA: hypothetical protein PLZ45_04135 [Ferruginibacter sp.]|nr:hypothetical protein [Chitinophagaceae bacterium]HRI23835.1 hypothetical protein [Ferruginibacter sp.]
MNRKKFLLNTAAGATALMFDPLNSFSRHPEPEPYKLETVKEFVIAGHSKPDRCREMLAEYPNLLYCRYDWGNGDFEEAIEGAGHLGNKEIARYLISQGARPNIYVLTMLGETAIVKAILEKYPALINGKGAHGFTLLHHATKGGDDSRELLEYFKEKGLKDMQIRIR